jgi:aryl-alcohol dehydrogenase-like predicted oxidoreductase
MERLEYGDTGIEISRLCYGTGHLNNVCESHAAGGALLSAAYDQGVTFWDTAEMYNSQLHVGAGLKAVGRDNVVVQTKAEITTPDGMQAMLEKSLREMDTEFIDIYFLHAVSSPEDLAEREGALNVLLDAKERGVIGAIGCSTHIYAGPVMDAVIDHPEMRVVLATANKEGRVLEGGPLGAHLDHLRRAHSGGMGVSIMKVIAAGKLPADDMPEWIRWGFDCEFAHAINLGMSNRPEIDLDAHLAHEHAEQRRAA